MSGKIKFETALKKIEDIVREFENEEMTLDELTERYEEGMNLISLCNDELSKAENRIEMLVAGKKEKKSRIRFKDAKEAKTPRQNTSANLKKSTPAEDMKDLY
ncbi:MAG: exodeoxyribonuclease VII small subunit [Candidatus Aureabacteria bacterium]|nr:exodeoxyribonuclease VII small subunit [Candidatus Auribacterota bacterium]